MRTRGRYTHLLFSLMFLLCCGMVSGCGIAQEADQPTPTERVAPTVQAAPQQPTDTPAPDVSTALFYNLPQTALNSPVPLYASPNRGDVISPAEIPAGEQVSVMARNPSSSHLRVVWNTGVGWIPVSFTDYNGQQQQLERLPVFEHEPPACAVPITTQFNLNAEWTSDQRRRVAVVVDMFRSTYGTPPPSSLLLTVNGTPVESTRRAIVERGQFSLKDVVFSLPGYIQEGDVLGYVLETTSDEPLTFIATIFSVPENCRWTD